jgi:hypothetical protein
MQIQEFDYSIDVEQVILWQYNEASNLKALVADEQAFIDINHSQFWSEWYDDVFNLLTANDFGLSIWSIILDVPYLIQQVGVVKPIWGFNELPVVNNYVNYERGNFARGSSRIILTTEEQRLFLRARYFQLTTDGCIISINNFLNLLFDDPDGIYQGGAWIVDNLDMTAEYVFNCPISSSLLAALVTYGVLPKPAGVRLEYTVL